jgi:pyruvate kinase
MVQVKCEVIAGGRLNPNTAISCAGVTVDCPAITEKDEDDIRFLLALEPPIDYLAVSFCQNADDIDQILDVMDDLEIPEERRPKILPR